MKKASPHTPRQALNDAPSQLCSGWYRDRSPLPHVRLFRRVFSLSHQTQHPELTIFAEGRYHLWVNGAYLGRGPIQRHPFRIFPDQYDLQHHLQSGQNVLAVAVLAPGEGLHNYIPSGAPGLVCELTCADAEGRTGVLAMDTQWRVTDQTGWQYPSPKRGWALGSIEMFDAQAAPHAWQSQDFDDSDWPCPELSYALGQLPHVTLEPTPLPNLRYAFAPARQIIGVEQVAAPTQPVPSDASSSALAQQMLDADFSPIDESQSLHGTLDAQGGGVHITGLTDQRGLALHVDLGQQYVGQPLFTITADSPGTVDFAYAELLEHDRPAWLRKGVSYADRIHAQRGVTTWEPLNFSAARYLTLMLRGFTGDVTINRLGLRASEPDLPWRGRFTSCHPNLDAIFKLCERTIRVGTQEGLMDCPSREQAAYIGDGHPVAQWLALLTGDLRHWRYLVREQFARQAPSGLLRSSPFSWRDDTLIDYNLIAILGTRDYLSASGDVALVNEVLPAARRVLDWFDSHCDADGLFALDYRTMSSTATPESEDLYDPSRPRVTRLTLFIDHPGWGCHNLNEPGIDRRGMNAAINFLLIYARRAMAECEQACGEAARAEVLNEQAHALARTARDRFFDPSRDCFVDGICDGEPSTQISEQTNTWAIMAQCCDRSEAQRIITRLLTGNEPTVARNGPYFWHYLLPQLARLDLHELALSKIDQRWSVMLEGDTTTAWETFAGDELDTRCHPWSCAPLPFLLRNVLGLPANLRNQPVILRPRFDLLQRAEGTVMTPEGEVAIRWEIANDKLDISGQLPAGIVARVLQANGDSLGDVRDAWHMSITAPIA